jgi:hypothetical protein
MLQEASKLFLQWDKHVFHKYGLLSSILRYCLLGWDGSLFLKKLAIVSALRLEVKKSSI